ncbi:MAG: hypothetical protein HYV38_00175 [Candidatus Levybacteria bacterium]|nr:hypothetical protein [Candidatus Levybacteria bacterium]
MSDVGGEVPVPEEVEVQPPQEFDVRATLDFADKVLRGENTGEWEDDSFDPTEVFMGPLIDLNREDLTDSEIKDAMAWIEAKLGAKLDEAPVQSRMVSPDGLTTVDVFGTRLGLEEDPYFLSRWQNAGEKPYFVMWQEQMYEEQLEGSGFEIRQT